MSLRRALYRLLAVSLSLLLALALVEVGLRLVGGEPVGAVDTAVKEPVQSRGKGVDWRGRRPPADKSEGVFRVLAIGDSFVWGAGVHAEDAWPGRLERRLAELESEVRFEVVNWSRPGWNTVQAWRATEPALAELAPDLLLLAFTLNDPEPGGAGRRELLYEPLVRRSPTAAASAALYRHSALYRLLWERLENRRQRRAFSAYYEALFQGPEWQACEAALASFGTAAAGLEAPLLLLVFPVFDGQLDGGYPYLGLHRKVAVAAAAVGIPVLDLLDAYRGIDARRLAVTPFTDPHPNELAHRIAADQIAIHLAAEGLVPARFPPWVRELPTAVSRSRQGAAGRR